MDFTFDKTQRGFDIITFTELYGAKCSLQKSSLATDDAIWFGVDDADPKILGKNGWETYSIPSDVLLTTRMHLSKDQVEKLLPYLQYFVNFGELPEKELK